MPADDIPAGLLDSLRQAGQVLFLTGSGVSAESGVPTFRDALTGLWSHFRPEELATPEAFLRDPQLVWDWYRERRRRVGSVQPNGAHLALARLQQACAGSVLVTQNVDGLHQRAGSRDVIEFHGNLFSERCRSCGLVEDNSDPLRDTPPPCPRCGTLMGPGVVWFGETIPQEALRGAWQAAAGAEIFFSIGTSGLVYPAAQLAEAARSAGALIVEINIDVTPLTASADLILQGPAGVMLPRIAEAVSAPRAQAGS